MKTADEVLEHFGIKGMRWGVRRTQAELHPSEDHVKAQAALHKAKKGGTKALSNQELQAAITRMNLEQQYSRVAPTTKGRRFLKSGGKFTGDILVGVGKQLATKVAADHATKLVGAAFKK